MQIARGVIGLVVTGHYPLNHHPGRLAIEHLEQYCFGWKEISQWFSYLQSILFVASTTAVGCCGPSLVPPGVPVPQIRSMWTRKMHQYPLTHRAWSPSIAAAATMGCGPLCLSTCLDIAQRRCHFRPAHVL